MYTYHYLHPERDNSFVAVFMTVEEADEYCERHNRGGGA
jgi:hypothetical protein